ncbi:hypothetical protein M8C21_021066 [Ambrosia artemisiifolia]|uniref:Uncharacterized protein n=1 Tax=Ambrosia artemisiifolia TaxID=4212 RepID=A0AAD5GIE8_AMBAR|nr:hypothetical protein M8C21_021066 [Ambrosia artemisiifolia]
MQWSHRDLPLMLGCNNAFSSWQIHGSNSVMPAHFVFIRFAKFSFRFGLKLRNTAPELKL